MGVEEGGEGGKEIFFVVIFLGWGDWMVEMGAGS